MNRGYVKLWRKTLDSGLLQNGPAWQLFGYLLLSATYKPCRKIVAPGSVVDLEPGQVVFSRRSAAQALGLGEQVIRTALNTLETIQVVTSRSTNKYTIISFVNWPNYQDEQPASNPQNHQRTTRIQPTPHPQPTRSPEATDQDKESKNINNNNNINTASDAADAGLPPVAGPVPAEETTPNIAAKRRMRKPPVQPLSPGEPYYRAKSGRFLMGKRLAAFERFWTDFAHAKGKAEAADAWLDIPGLNGALVEHICHAARCEAEARRDLEARGQTPKWAQGWLNSRRWEDYAPRLPTPQAQPVRESWELSPDEIERRRQIGLKQARAWRLAHGEKNETRTGT